ncbi:putative antirepressor - phage associated [Leuconostoc kimchii IMSNU 11154]|uniref:Putative antirepressor-phage associated n=1 Tax=Leuconostoc kimchii (strain IMSNU 11154 / KCTC 2386 / IH25) TaxID=762051 RepID=D5T4H0_LEUKI|nr:BRO family protein [Leuconostoc kimchii]ADG41441.1 putative antirepressor - phage associated [Leuconostoc kimchii IMSNU 11154]
MNEVAVFNFETNEVRTVVINEEVWLVAKDVATTLGYSRTADAVKAHVDEEDKGVGKIQTPGGTQRMTVINQSGVISLALSSKLPTAKKFKRWVTSEVIPSVLKHGSYSKPQSTLQLFDNALQVMKEQETKINHVVDRMDEFEDAQEIRSWEQTELLRMRKNKVFAILGSKHTKRYKALSSEVYQSISHDFKSQFNVPRYNALPRKQFEDGKRFFINWEPSNLLELAIKGAEQPA